MTGSGVEATKSSGIVHTLDPAGSNRVALLSGTSSTGFFRFINDNYSLGSSLEYSRSSDIDFTTAPFKHFDIKQARGGGALVGASATFGPTTDQGLALWRGSRKVDYTTGTLTATVNSRTITGSGTTWSTNVEPGMFLFLTAGGEERHFVGVVKTVDSNTQLTLEANALVAATAGSLAYRLQSRRGLMAKVMKGRITTATTSAIVTGATTKFKDQGIKAVADTWLLFRHSDNTFVGTITSVQSNTSMTLTGNAAVAMSNERYFAVNTTGAYGTRTNGLTSNGAVSKFGFAHAVYAERQFYANHGRDLENTTRLYFSDPQDLEGVDMSPTDGDFLNIGSARGSSSGIRALQAAYNALIILKEDESYALRGTTPSSFAVTKLGDDGCLSGMSSQTWQGGVIWAGRNGIYHYNGVEVENIVEATLGDYYKELVRSFNPANYRMWSMVVRDHYFLFIESCTPPITPVRGAIAQVPTQLTICINLPKKAVTLHTNLNIRGSITLPADTDQAPWYIVNGWSTVLVPEGNTPDGSYQSEPLDADVMLTTRWTTGSALWVPRLQAYLDTQSVPAPGGEAPSGVVKARMALYDDDSGLPDNLLFQTEETEIPVGVSGAWVNFDFPDAIKINGGLYHMGLIVDRSNIVNVRTVFDSLASNALERDYDLGFADPFGPPNPGIWYDKAVGFRMQAAQTGSVETYICDSEALFQAEDRDDIGCDEGMPGPDFYYEAKKFNAGDSLRKKLFKQLAIHYISADGELMLDTVVGLNNEGQTRRATLPSTEPTWAYLSSLYGTWASFANMYGTWDAISGVVFRARRLKFLKRSTHLSFRIYQGSCLMTRVQLGPFQVAFKLQRPGRI